MQSKLDSLRESCFKVFIGYFVNTFMSMVIWGGLGHKLELDTAMIGGLLFTLTSIVKNYLVRRLFNWFELRKEQGLPHTFYSIIKQGLSK